VKAQVCPVCNGKGTVPPYFYLDVHPDIHARQKCRTCKGRGIVMCEEEKFYLPTRSHRPFIDPAPWILPYKWTTFEPVIEPMEWKNYPVPMYTLRYTIT